MCNGNIFAYWLERLENTTPLCQFMCSVTEVATIAFYRMCNVIINYLNISFIDRSFLSNKMQLIVEFLL